MLDIMRKHADTWVIKVLLLGVALSFLIGFGAFFYIKDLLGKGGKTSDTAIVVNGEKISASRYGIALKNYKERMQEMYKENFDKIAQYLNLEEQAANELINETVLKQEAERLNLKVSDSELFERIKNYPIFQTNGKFDPKKYKDFFQRRGRRGGFSESQFLDGERQNILIKKFIEIVTDSAKVSDKEAENEYRLRNEKVNLNYIEINPSNLEADIQVEEEEAKTYFENNKEKFEIPEKRQAAYLKISSSDYINQVTVTQEEIETYYEENKANYVEPEQVKARHILIKTEKNAPSEKIEEARKKAELILEDLKKGADFEIRAKADSDDTATKEKGGDLGYFSRGKMVPEFEEAAFGLGVGELSDIVKTTYGFHIIKVEDKKEAYTKSLEEVSSSIEEELKKQASKRMAEQKGEEIATALKDSKSPIEEYAKENNIEVKTTGMFTQADNLTEIENSFIFVKKVFELEEIGDISDLIHGNNFYYIAQLKNKEIPKIPEFNDVKDKVIAEVKKEKGLEKGKKLSEEIIEKLKNGKSLQEVASEYNYEVKSTGPFTRRGGYIPQIGTSDELKRDAFNLTKETPSPLRFYEISQKFIIPTLKEKEEFDKTKFEAEKEKLKKELLNSKKDYLLQSWLERRKEISKIEKRYTASLTKSSQTPPPLYFPEE